MTNSQLRIRKCLDTLVCSIASHLLEQPFDFSIILFSLESLWQPRQSFHAEDTFDGKLDFSLANGMMTYGQRKDSICGKDWQDNYKKLHKDILQSRRPRQFIVLSCKEAGFKCAGYGNRLGGIASLLFLSILTQRAFLIEWNQAGVPLDNFLLPKGIEWNYSTENLKDLSTRRQYWGKRDDSKKRKKRNDMLMPWSVKTDFVAWLQQADLQAYLDHPVEKVVANWYFAETLWENPFLEKNVLELGISNERSEYSLIGCAFDFLFQKSRELEIRLDAARRSLSLGSQVPRLGLQIRMGDVSFGKGSLRNNNIDYRTFFACAQSIGEALARQRKDTIKKHVKWFLATDDLKIKQYALENYPLNVVTLNITPQHIKSLKTGDSESIEGTFGVIMDHFLLSECDFLVLSRSSFGKTAAGLFFHSEETIAYGDTCKPA